MQIKPNTMTNTFKILQIKTTELNKDNPHSNHKIMTDFYQTSTM